MGLRSEIRTTHKRSRSEKLNLPRELPMVRCPRAFTCHAYSILAGGIIGREIQMQNIYAHTGIGKEYPVASVADLHLLLMFAQL
jgi:hypothetical protein